MIQNAIVTGANGFIGRQLISKLVHRGVYVLAIDKSFAGPSLSHYEQVEWVEADINDLERTAALMPLRHYDVMFHLAWAGVNGAEKCDIDIQIDNIRMGINAARLCKKTGVDRLMCAGTVAEHCTGSLPMLSQVSGGMTYGVAKHCARQLVETYCKQTALPFVWMQFSNIYGVGNRTGNLVSYTLETLLRNEHATFGPACQPYDFIYIDDLLEAVCLLAESENPQSFYYIGSGEPRVLKDYLLRIGELAGKSHLIDIGKRPDDGIRYDYSMFDTQPLTALIGRYAVTPFDTGIRKTLEWLTSLQDNDTTV